MVRKRKNIYCFLSCEAYRTPLHSWQTSRKCIYHWEVQKSTAKAPFSGNNSVYFPTLTPSLCLNFPETWNFVYLEYFTNRNKGSYLTFLCCLVLKIFDFYTLTDSHTRRLKKVRSTSCSTRNLKFVRKVVFRMQKKKKTVKRYGKLKKKKSKNRK